MHPDAGAARRHLGRREGDGAAGQGAEAEEDDPGVLSGRRGVRHGGSFWKGAEPGDHLPPRGPAVEPRQHVEAATAAEDVAGASGHGEPSGLTQNGDDPAAGSEAQTGIQGETHRKQPGETLPAVPEAHTPADQLHRWAAPAAGGLGPSLVP